MLSFDYSLGVVIELLLTLILNVSRDSSECRGGFTPETSVRDFTVLDAAHVILVSPKTSSLSLSVDETEQRDTISPCD